MSRNLGPDAFLVRVQHGARTVGLGLLGSKKPSSFALRHPPLFLHESGDPMQDRIMTEYNGLLAQEGWEDDVADIFLATVGDSLDLGRRDLYLSGVAGDWIGLCRRRKLATRLLRSPQAAPYAMLQTPPTSDPLAAMTRNSRQQIRRSLRTYEARAPLTLDRAGNVEQALAWLDALDALHTLSWRQRGEKGAFADGRFKEFHRYLIAIGFADGVPDILRLRSGDSVLGYLYNLRWKGVVSCYQSGFHYEDDPHARPGLVAHVLAMAMYRGEDMAIYRFLAGDDRYKNSLATGKDELLWMVAYRPSMARWLSVAAAALSGAFLGRR